MSRALTSSLDCSDLTSVDLELYQIPLSMFKRGNPHEPLSGALYPCVVVAVHASERSLNNHSVLAVKYPVLHT